MTDEGFSRRRMLKWGASAAGALLATGIAACDTQTSSARPSATTEPATTRRPVPTTTPATTVPPPTGPAVAIMRGDSGRPQVAMTFHGSGPVSITKTVMGILAAHQAHATVFAIGEWLAANPEVGRIVLDGGNEFGNHTWSHPPLSTYAPGPMYEEIVKCRDELVKVTGSPGAFFRQSDGQHATHEECVQAGRAGYRRILNYDIDSTDWEGTSTATIRRAVGKATAGSVISMHLGRQNTIAALPAVLDDLKGRRLAVVTGTELLA